MQIFQNFKRNNWIFLFLGIFINSIVIFSMILDLVYPEIRMDIIAMERVFQGAKTFFYFTNQSNILLGVGLILLAFKTSNEKVKQFYFSTVVLITITFIIYWALISWTSDWSKPLDATISLFTHAINPILGFVVLFLIRKSLTINTKTILFTGCYLLGYFIFAFILYFATLQDWEIIVKKTGEKRIVFQGVSIYKFLNFKNPLFYSGTNVFLIILLDLFMLFLGLSIPILLSIFWLKVFKIKTINNFKKIKFKK